MIDICEISFVPVTVELEEADCKGVKITAVRLMDEDGIKISLLFEGTASDLYVIRELINTLRKAHKVLQPEIGED